MNKMSTSIGLKCTIVVAAATTSCAMYGTSFVNFRTMCCTFLWKVVKTTSNSGRPILGSKFCANCASKSPSVRVSVSVVDVRDVTSDQDVVHTQQFSLVE